MMCNSPSQFLNRDVDIEEMSKYIKKCKNNKAPGLDALMYEVLKNNSSIKALTTLMNKCLDAGIIPSVWAKGIISPIPKSTSSDPRVPLNYRGISLLPVIAKIYSGVMAGRVRDLLEKNHRLANKQNGFRPDRSCLDHVFTFDNPLRIRKSKGLETFCAFVDFQKAFDYVDHDFLLYKLYNKGIDGRIYNAIKAIYSSPSSCVLVNDRLTDWFEVNSGVGQGDSLSPSCLQSSLMILHRRSRNQIGRASV